MCLNGKNSNLFTIWLICDGYFSGLVVIGIYLVSAYLRGESFVLWPVCRLGVGDKITWARLPVRTPSPDINWGHSGIRYGYKGRTYKRDLINRNGTSEDASQPFREIVISWENISFGIFLIKKRL